MQVSDLKLGWQRDLNTSQAAQGRGLTLCICWQTINTIPILLLESNMYVSLRLDMQDLWMETAVCDASIWILFHCISYLGWSHGNDNVPEAFVVSFIWPVLGNNFAKWLWRQEKEHALCSLIIFKINLSYFFV